MEKDKVPLDIINKDRVWNRIKKYIYISIALFIILIFLFIGLLILNVIIYKKLVILSPFVN